MIYYTDVKGAAWVLRLRESTVYERIRRQAITFKLFGRHYLVPVEALIGESGKSQREIIDLLKQHNLALWGGA